MQFSVKIGDPCSEITPVLVLGVFEDESVQNAPPEVKQVLDNALSRKAITGKPGETLLITPTGNLPAHAYLFAGAGKKETLTLENIRKASAAAAQIARDQGFTKITTLLHTLPCGESHHERAQAATEGIILGLYKFCMYKAGCDDKKIEEVVFLAENEKTLEHARAGVQEGEIVASAVNYARDLGNMPANDATPTYLADEAKKLEREYTDVRVLNKKMIEKENMRALLAVNKGSSEDPCFVIINYNKNANKKIALVGKGITFDSGGLNLKPESGLIEMKMDMCGAAAVIAIIRAAQQLNINANIIGVFAATENMTGCAAYKPGDIIKSRSGKTIEVINTDAEGRLILADALDYTCKELKPEIIIDIATLTGAAWAALGNFVSALMTTDKTLGDELKRAGEHTHDRVVELPLFEEYDKDMESDIADIKNLESERPFRAQAAAAFLKAFVTNARWAHLDIAGSGMIPKAHDYVSAGATGSAIRLLVAYLQNAAKTK